MSENKESITYYSLVSDPFIRLSRLEVGHNAIFDFYIGLWIFQDLKEAESVAANKSSKIFIKPIYSKVADVLINGNPYQKKAMKCRCKYELLKIEYEKNYTEFEILSDHKKIHKSFLYDAEPPSEFNHQQKYDFLILKEAFHRLEKEKTRLEDLLEVYEELESKVPIKVEDVNNDFKCYSCAELLSMPSKMWMIDDLIGSQDIGMIYGASGSGKTFFVLDLLVSACLGRKFANSFGIKKPINIAYCAGEGHSALRNRFSAALKNHGVENIENFSYYSFTPQLYSSDKEGLTLSSISNFIQRRKILEKSNSQKPLDIVIIDTLHSACNGADENSAKDMGKVLALCKVAAKELGCAVILVHHTTKNGNNERGSSALRGAMDFMIEISRSETSKTSQVKCSKLKDGNEWGIKTFEIKSSVSTNSAYVNWLEPIENLTKNLSQKDQEKKCIIEHLKLFQSHKFHVKEITGLINQNNDYTRRLLDELTQEKRCGCGLENDKKKPSKSNSYRYWISD